MREHMPAQTTMASLSARIDNTIMNTLRSPSSVFSVVITDGEKPPPPSHVACTSARRGFEPPTLLGRSSAETWLLSGLPPLCRAGSRFSPRKSTFTFSDVVECGLEIFPLHYICLEKGSRTSVPCRQIISSQERGSAADQDSRDSV